MNNNRMIRAKYKVFGGIHFKTFDSREQMDQWFNTYGCCTLISWEVQ